MTILEKRWLSGRTQPRKLLNLLMRLETSFNICMNTVVFRFAQNAGYAGFKPKILGLNQEEMLYQGSFLLLFYLEWREMF